MDFTIRIQQNRILPWWEAGQLEISSTVNCRFIRLTCPLKFDLLGNCPESHVAP
jgi:hypothetical protein